MNITKNPASITVVYWLVNMLLAVFVVGAIHLGIISFRNFSVMAEYDFPAEIFWPVLISALLALLKIFLSFLPLVIFRRFIKNVRQGNTFSEINLNYLKKLAHALGALCLLQVIDYAINFYWMNGFEQAEHIYYHTTIGWKFIIAIFTWSLAHIFSVGLSLQREKDLTI